MSSLIQELQRDALDGDIGIIELLHKCLVVATKLNLEEFSTWVRLELSGYGKEDEVPKYRVVHGAPQVFNPYRGYQPLYFGDDSHAEGFSKMHFNQPIGELEHDLLHAKKSGSSGFHISYSPSIEKMLMEAIDYNLQPSLNVNASQFQKILDAVRKISLEWSLTLESDGITGKGMSFSHEEKEKAKSDTYHIKNYIQGDISNSQLQIEATHSHQLISTVEYDIEELKRVTQALRDTINALGVQDDEKDELISEIVNLEAQSESPNPKNSIISESIASVRRILEGASGNLVASGLLQQIGALFGV